MRLRPRERVCGLTLIEVLIVLAVLSFLLAAALPAFSELVQARRVEQHSRSLLGAINLARAEAIMRGSSVTICPSQMWRTGQANCSGVYSDGWIVFANANRSAAFEAGQDEVLRVFSALPAGYRVMNRPGTQPVGGRINYLPDGSAHRTLTLQLCPPSAAAARLSIVLNIVGRARLERNWGTCVAVT